MNICSNLAMMAGFHNTKITDFHIPTSVKNPELVRKRRGQIIHAAMKLFVQKGFHKTTIRDISKKAGLSLGAIYEYIRNKEEIFVLNQEIFLESAGGKLRQAIENIEDPLDKLRRLIHTELQLMERYAEYLMFVTRERHYLSQEYMNMTLQIERKRLGIFDEVIKECIDAGIFEPFNVGLITQLIKVMIDAWIMKSWDLRGKVDISEMESTIWSILLNGLLKKESREQSAGYIYGLNGKKVFFVNGGTPIGKCIVPFLASKGAQISVYSLSFMPWEERKNTFTGIRFYSEEENGPLDISLFRKILSEMRHMDIYIQDLGIGNLSTVQNPDSMEIAGRRLDRNLITLHEIASPLKEIMSKNGLGHCFFIAPWAWDRYSNPLRYEALKGALIALTKTMANELAGYFVNVHCIIPDYIRPPHELELGKFTYNELMEKIPSHCLGDISDIINTLIYLCSSSAKFLTGHVWELARGEGQK